MGIDFDENGKNDEYGADENESTGELGDAGKPRRSAPAAPLVLAPTPQVHGNVNDLIANIMGPPAAAPQTVQQALESTQDSYMDEVEERLEIAAYFRSALNNPLFDNDTKAARIVQHEISGFIRERLGVLLGLGEPKKPNGFSDDQTEILKSLGDLSPAHVTALRMVASKLVGEPPAAREEPVLRQAKAPAAPVVRQAPAPSRRAPAPSPVPTQTARASTPPQTQPTQDQPRRGPGRPPGSKNKSKDTEQMVHAVRKHADGTEEPLFNEDGSPRMVRVPRIQRPAGALPMPNDTQMVGVTAAQAGSRAATLEQNPAVRAALTGLQHPV